MLDIYAIQDPEWMSVEAMDTEAGLTDAEIAQANALRELYRMPFASPEELDDETKNRVADALDAQDENLNSSQREWAAWTRRAYGEEFGQTGQLYQALRVFKVEFERQFGLGPEN